MLGASFSKLKQVLVYHRSASRLSAHLTSFIIISAVCVPIASPYQKLQMSMWLEQSIWNASLATAVAPHDDAFQTGFVPICMAFIFPSIFSSRVLTHGLYLLQQGPNPRPLFSLAGSLPTAFIFPSRVLTHGLYLLQQGPYPRSLSSPAGAPLL